MNLLPVLPALALSLSLSGAPVELQVHAPAYPDQQVTLYRYTDLFTRQLLPLASGRTDAHGAVSLQAEVEGTQKALLRIGLVGADLWLRAGTYRVTMPPPDPGQVRSLSGTARVDLIFEDLDPLDVNALMSDLNGRLDAFLAEQLATDQDAGMQAVAQARREGSALVPDSIGEPGLHLGPTWTEGRVDTFSQKLLKFYAGVDDPWFQRNLEYGIAGLHMGPRHSDRELYNRYLKDRPMQYDVPEQVRFFTSFYTDHLLRFPFRSAPGTMQRLVREGRTDSLKALLARNELAQDERLNELVLLTGLYALHGNALFDAAGVLRSLRQLEAHAQFPEHRKLAATMVWDLTAMRAGSHLPPVALLDTAGHMALLDSLLRGPTFVMVAMPGNPYSDQELAALRSLQETYRGHARFIHIALDKTPEELARWLRSAPQAAGLWRVPADQQRLLDDLRIRSAPAFFMLDGGLLTDPPGPRPSEGLGAMLHRIKVRQEQQERQGPDRGLPPPKR